MRPQHRRLQVFRLELGHDLRPQEPRRAKLGDLHEEIHADSKKERQARRKIVDIETRGQRRAHILAAVGQRKGEFLHLRRTRFLHVIAGNRDRVELRHVLRAEADNVGDDAHRRFGRIDIGVAHHELFQNIVLNGSLELLGLHALLLGCDDVVGENGDDGAVHRHRDGHFVKRNLVEENFHVFDRIDRHSCLADIADDARVVAVIAAMRGEIESDRKALLAAREIAPVKCIRFFRRREPGILPDRPWPSGIHRRLRAAGVGRKTRQRVGVISLRRQPLQIVGRVERLDVDAFRRLPDKRGRARALGLLCNRGFPVLKRLLVGHFVFNSLENPRISPCRYCNIAASVPKCGRSIGEPSGRVKPPGRRGTRPPFRCVRSRVKSPPRSGSGSTHALR